MPGVAAGMLLAWARSLGEFGATITFAGNYPGITQTMPLLIYGELQSDPRGGVRAQPGPARGLARWCSPCCGSAGWARPLR